MTIRTPATLSPDPVRYGLLFISLSIAALAQPKAPVPVYSWTTLAGRASIGVEDGPAAYARFNNPHGLAMDLADNMFVADTGNHTIRKITPAGLVSTFAGAAGVSGSSDGVGSAARFNGPQDVGVDPQGNVYVADTGNHTIRKISPVGVVTTLAGQAGKKGMADGAASAALFDSPDNLTVDTQGNVYLYNNGERKISGGQVQTIQIPPPALILPKMNPSDYFRIHKIFNDVAGNSHVVIDGTDTWGGNQSYFGADIQADGSWTGAVGFVSPSPLGYWTIPLGCAVDQSGHWFYTRQEDDAIIGKAGTSRTTIDGLGQAARLDSVGPMTIDAAGNIWISESRTAFFPGQSSPVIRGGVNLRKITSDGTTTTIIQPTIPRYWSENSIGLAADAAANVYFAKTSGVNGMETELLQISAAGTISSIGTMPSTFGSRGLISDASGKLFTISSYRKILQRLSDGNWTVFAGGDSSEIKDGTSDEARFSSLSGLYVDRHGDFFGYDYVLDSQGSRTADFFLRKISSAGVVTTLGKNLIRGVEDSKGRFFIAHPDLNTITQIDAQGSEVTIGGLAGVDGSADGNGEQARFASPASLAIDAQDNLYFIDGFGTTVRKGQYVGIGPTITIQPQSLVATSGTNVQLTVAATGTPAPTYQWFFGGTALSGATGTSLSLSNLRSTDAGDYTVVVTNALGSVTSSKATLTVGSAPAPAPAPTAGSSGGGGSIEEWFACALLSLSAMRGFKRCLRSR